MNNPKKPEEKNIDEVFYDPKEQKTPSVVFYITTAIDYVNAPPHIGHAYEKIAADILSRYWRKVGHQVFFLTGTDEHGLKIAQAAETSGEKPQKYVDDMATRYQATWSALEIKYDNFIRTTDPEHEKYVQNFLSKLHELGDIYKDRYQGLYCVGCEEYKMPKELIDSKVCPVHKSECQAVYEDVYFFKLSKYQSKLIDIIASGKIEVLPVSRKNEILSFLKEPLGYSRPLGQNTDDLCLGGRLIELYHRFAGKLATLYPTRWRRDFSFSLCYLAGSALGGRP